MIALDWRKEQLAQRHAGLGMGTTQALRSRRSLVVTDHLRARIQNAIQQIATYLLLSERVTASRIALA